MIALEKLCKRYGDFFAVREISLSVPSGQIFAFLGVNGAGKTTTIRMITGILKPTSGRIILGSHSLTEDPLAAKSITGYIPDRPHIYNKLTGREFLYFICDLYRVDPSTHDYVIDELLHEYHLSEWQNELVENYSHGMKQRLATCAALVHKPKILVVDEPMVGLDAHGAKLLKERLRHYASTGVTIFLSTHSLNVAEEVADTIAIIHRGVIATQGTLDEVKDSQGRNDQNLEEIFLEITSQESDEGVPSSNGAAV